LNKKRQTIVLKNKNTAAGTGSGVFIWNVGNFSAGIRLRGL